jgi:uncharacterized hydrophobic protein (TIGR00271 family)
MLPTEPSSERTPAIPGVNENQHASTVEAAHDKSTRDRSAADRELRELRRTARIAIGEGARFDRPFVLSNLAATVIASAGLLGDSTATIIGAMLIATLMGPIMGIGLALVDFDSRLLWRALLTLTAGTAMVLGVSVLCGLLAPPMSPSPEMLSRTSPRLLDLIVALASGAICAYAVTSPRLNAALFGVSIAVALVPPLATAGLFIARAEWRLAGSAFLLAFTNMVAIQVGTSSTLWLRGFRGRDGLESARVEVVLRRQVVSLVLMTALAVTLGTHGLKLIRQRYFQGEVREVIQSALISRPEARLVEMIFITQGGQTIATAVVRSPVRFTNADVAAMQKRLPSSPDGSPVRLRLRHVEVDIVGDGG